MFTYTEVTEFIEAPHTLKNRIKDVELSNAEITEITGYMKEFVRAVDSEYQSDIEYNKRLTLLRGGM